MIGTRHENIELVVDPAHYFADVADLVKQLTDIARDGFGSLITEEDVENHVLRTEFIYLVRQEGKLVGFSSYDRFGVGDNSILYLNGIVVRRDAQRAGVFRRVNSLALASGDDDFLVMRTQNPVIYAATRVLVKEIYPNGGIIPEDIKSLASAVACDRLKMQDFSAETFVGRGTYGVSLYDVIPQHPKAELFDQLGLEYERGDSVLIVGRLK